MGQYLPSSSCWCWPWSSALISFVVSRLLAPRRPQRGQGGAVRVRHRAQPRAARALPGELLPGGDALHHVRHRDHLPLPVRGERGRARRVRVLGDHRLQRRLLPLLRVRGGQGRPRLGPAGHGRAGSARRSCRPSAPPQTTIRRVGLEGRGRGGQPDGPSATCRDEGLAGLDHNFLTGRLEDLVQWARARSQLAGHLRPGLLRHRDDGRRRRALRPGPLRHGGLPGLAPPGRHHDRGRPGQPEDGPGAPPDLRPDDGAQVGHLHGRVRLHRWHVQQLRHRPGRRPDRAGRRLRPGLPARRPRRSSTPSPRCARTSRRATSCAAGARPAPAPTSTSRPSPRPRPVTLSVSR